MSLAEPLVGIIANPASGKDIRRLIAHATVVDNQGKIGIIRRVLVGLGAAGVGHVAIMPDRYRLGEQAHGGLAHSASDPTEISLLDMPITNTATDSERAARRLRRRGVRVIIVLGGDGTMRVVSKGAGDIPLLPISTGTNNVLPDFIEGTTAGWAAGVLARGQVQHEAVVWRHKWIEVAIDGQPSDRALVDVAAVRGQFVGSRAVWDVRQIRRLAVTRAHPANIGISAIVAATRIIAPQEPLGMAARLSPDSERRLQVALGPGLVSTVGLETLQPLQAGEVHTWTAEEPLLLALDGEREATVEPGQRVGWTLRLDGPWIVNARRAMEEMVARRLFDR